MSKKPSPDKRRKKTAFKPTLYQWRNPSLIPPLRIRLRTPLCQETHLSATVAPRRYRQDILDHRQRDGDGLEPPNLNRRRASIGGARLVLERRRSARGNRAPHRHDRIHYKVGPEDIGDRLFFETGRDTEIIIASQTKSGAL